MARPTPLCITDKLIFLKLLLIVLDKRYKEGTIPNHKVEIHKYKDKAFMCGMGNDGPSITWTTKVTPMGFNLSKIEHLADGVIVHKRTKVKDTLRRSDACCWSSNLYTRPLTAADVVNEENFSVNFRSESDSVVRKARQLMADREEYFDNAAKKTKASSK